MNLTFEEIVGTPVGRPFEDQVKTCVSEILSTIRHLADQGMSPDVIIKALTEAQKTAVSSL
jgi:hypothetical protein